jgi:hypothetical protein
MTQDDHMITRVVLEVQLLVAGWRGVIACSLLGSIGVAPGLGI